MGPKRQNALLVAAIISVSLYCYLLGTSSFSSSKSTTSATTTTSRSTSGTLRQKPRDDSIVKKKVKERECTIFVAPSSLKGNPGYGIFTTRDLFKGDKILGGPDGLSIPVEGYAQKNVPKAKWKRHWINLWNPYWWGRGVPDHVMYEAGRDFVDYQIGFGYLPNHHCILASLNPEYPDERPPYDDSMVNRYTSPGAGAFSYNIGREFTSTRDVLAGEELFMSYGYCQHGQGPGWTEYIYMPSEFGRASDIIWDRIKPSAPHSFNFDQSGNVVLEEGLLDENDEQTKAHLVKELLPTNLNEVQTLLAAPLSRQSLPKYLAQSKGVIKRTPDWIRENGMCLETMVAQPSTIPHAGQGGFAQISMKQGDIVAMAPLLHVMDKDALALYDETGEHQIGWQLLLNYCFSNPRSSLLLCPTTNAVVINHCSLRKKQCGPKGPNAEYRWSTGWDQTSDEWRKQSMEALAKKNFRGLSFEIYATRDIEVGEEVFIDYGELWEEAWARHVETWKPPPKINQAWISAKEANEKGGPILPALMLKRGNVYDVVSHPYLMTGCVYHPSSDDEHKVYQQSGVNWQEWKLPKIMEEYSDDGSKNRYKYANNKGYANHNDGLHWPCSVLWAEQSTYVVRIHQSPTRRPTPWSENGLPRILHSYPRESIRYFVKPFASDQHLPGVFRQPIGLRDDILPQQWNNNIDSVGTDA